MSEQAEAERPRRDDPLRLATPRIDDVEARRARASVASRLFGGPREPVRVGRYQVLGRIGAGGMGVVYRAHDPELARDVAVKFMNSEGSGNAEATTARARLVREARAMARLAHPNVIHVYDVGTVDDGVFIAMELVEGESLSNWLAREGRDWQGVLRRYVDAGRGLAAAHAAGVVHRDFKPENVLVGIDGRVRVGDFGLAGAPAIGGTPSFDDVRSADAELDASLSGSALTRTGALLGTPKYMAPEQEHDALASARSDQFSFCVALYEGLYGRPPFEGDTIARYRRNVRHGRVLPPPLDTKVKSWVHAEIVRGMAVDPAERHPGMEVLLDKLERALVEPRIGNLWFRRLAVGVPLVAAAVTLGVIVGAQKGDTNAAASSSDESGGGERDLEEPDEPDTLAIVPPAPATTRGEPGATSSSSASKASAAGTAVVSDERKAATPARPTKAKGPVCFWTEDGYEKLDRPESKRQRWIRDAAGNCYHCVKKVPASALPDLKPKDGCGDHRLCVKEARESCDEQASG